MARLDLNINIDVDDLEAAVRFYTTAFDLSVGRRLGPEVVELLGAAIPIYLLTKPPGSQPFPGATRGRGYDRHWTPVHLDFAVDDLEAAVDRARQAGARGDSAITAHAWGRMALMVDPFGHGFCLLEFTGRGYDEIAS